ncbi:MAG TPA: hypothetical protein VGK47_11095 [Nitrososphaeraceae archaeon]
MADLVYTAGLPNPPNFPSQDVGSMQTNTNSINTWVVQDHFGFNTNDNTGGYHDQVSLKDQAAPGIPAGLNGVLFSNDVAGRSWPFWQNALGSFQITGSAAANVPLAAANGYTFLPGGIIVQWGNVNPAPINQAPVTQAFNIPFPTACFAIVSGQTYINGFPPANSIPGTVAFSNVVPASFDWVVRTITNYDGFYWVAIGN